MDRLGTQKSRRVDVGDHPEDGIGVNLLRIQGERTSSGRFQETEFVRRCCRCQRL